jgi:hypothetical protein
MKALFAFLYIGRAVLAVGTGAYAAALLGGDRYLKTSRGIVHLSAEEAVVAGIVTGLLAVGIAASVWRDIEPSLSDGASSRRQHIADVLMKGSILSAFGIILIGVAVALVWR